MMPASPLPRRYRTQVQAGQTLTALAIFLAMPVGHPSLWPLEIWGNFQVPAYTWTLILGIVGITLLRTRNLAVASIAMTAAAMLMFTIAGAAYLALGWNGLTLMAFIKALHCIWTAVDLKAAAQRGLDAGA